MIKDIVYPTAALRAGDAYTLRIVAPEPVTVQIKCFTKEPPPPGFRPCPECGSFRARSGEVLKLSVSDSNFRAAGGAIEVFVEDGEGDSRRLSLKVLGLEENRGTPAMSGGNA